MSVLELWIVLFTFFVLLSRLIIAKEMDMLAYAAIEYNYSETSWYKRHKRHRNRFSTQGGERKTGSLFFRWMIFWSVPIPVGLLHLQISDILQALNKCNADCIELTK